MKSEIQIENRAGACRIDIEGTIGVPEEWQFDDPEARVATYDRFRDTVRRIGALDASEIVVEIRSTGGDVNDALLIHDALRGTGARIVTRCYGYTASAATIIAQAASEGCREISANALYLIHNAVCTAEGNASELAGKTELLRRTDERIAEIYASRSGRPASEFEALMAENNGGGRWLSPAEAIEAGLADRLTDGQELPEPSLVRNVVRGWDRLLSRVGIRRDGNPPEDRNILHFDEPERRPAAAPAAAAGDLRRRIGPTRTLPCEDPSCGDTIRSANELAYSEDARQFRKGCNP